MTASAEAVGGAGGRPKARRVLVLRIAIALAVVAALVLLGREAAALLPRFVEWVHGLGSWGAVAFVVGYAIAAVAFIPGSLLTLVGGAIFGLLWGVVLVFLGATAGSTLAFLIARYAARPAVERRLGQDPRLKQIDRAVESQGFRMVLLLRLSPVFPFTLLNYALGLTRVRLRDYVLASLGMLPGTLLYVYYGKAAGDVATLLTSGAPRGSGYYVVMGVGLVATLLVTVLITRIARRELAKETNDNDAT
ncbi:MAG: TVP38/TMEM64 family protein [Gemmatimonadetes bacterium]|nr:TVP38/TMEM64 family protein [Gemmatimonadota bacterium]